MQWANILGAKKVVILGRDKKLVNLTQDLGADAVINTSNEDFKKMLWNKLKTKVLITFLKQSELV